MASVNGLKNFSVNIKPLMKKLQEAHKPEQLTCAEMNQIVQFYLETVDLIHTMKPKFEEHYENFADTK